MPVYKTADYLVGLILAAIASVTAFFPEMVLFSGFGWIWQLIVGVALCVAGVMLIAVVDDTTEWPRLKLLYAISGSFAVVIGVIVFANFNRYESILSETGSWPLWVCGGVIIASIPAAVAFDILKERRKASNEAARQNPARA